MVIAGKFVVEVCEFNSEIHTYYYDTWEKVRDRLEEINEFKTNWVKLSLVLDYKEYR